MIALIVLVCIPLQVTAYSNTNAGGHPSINRYAVDYFEKKILPYDSLLKNTSIRGEASYGWAWDETDGKKNTGPTDSINLPKEGVLQDWIKDGGYSADEPEYTMALVHFYDPTNVNEPWLTDPWLIMNKYTEFLARAMDSSLVVPDLSAVHWAFDGGAGAYASRGAYFIQDYSWDDGLQYYKDALADTSRENENYGQAWRAVGETMHLVSDMTIPAHVRNDGHPTLNEDPYENSVDAWEVTHYKNGPFLDLNYNQGTLRDLMIRTATVVNKNFYSADTTPTGYQVTGSDSFYTRGRYSQPSLEGLTADADGYYYYPPGRKLARGVLYSFEPISPPKYTYTGTNEPIVLMYRYHLDYEVLKDQRRVLIPTAIRASAEVLDRFLPRFKANIEVEKYVPEDPSDEQYIVYTTLKQVHTEPDAWSGYDLTVRNGAYLVEITPGGTQTEEVLSLGSYLYTPEDPDFNYWYDLFSFKPGTRIYMAYDLGGYVIKSNEVEIPTVTTPIAIPDEDWDRDPKECPSNWYVDGICYNPSDTIREHSGESGNFD